MIRKIIQIDEKKCNGCGLCADACHEGAIAVKDGKARLLRDDYCDGLGNCLPVCPEGAITFVQREAAAYDEAAVQKHLNNESALEGCPGLKNWPVQIKLAPVNASCFSEADLLIAADCTAYAYGKFHEEFMQDKITLIGCPKLDAVDYSEKLAEILKQNSVKSITIVRMEVPCCGGIVYAVQRALEISGLQVSVKTHVISTQGSLLV